MQIFHTLQDGALVAAVQSGMRTCIALGLFDGLHHGHQSVIGAAVDRAKAEGLTPCVFTFSTGRQSPAGKPDAVRLLSDDLAGQILTELGVECLIRPDFEEFRGLSPEEFVGGVLHRTLGARYLFCGENYHFGRQAAGNAGDLQRLGAALGIETTTLPLEYLESAPVSSTRIRERIAAGDMEAAGRMLGRLFAIDFEVIRGRQLGRTLDSPTINQAFPPRFAIPRFGVYATVTTVDGVKYSSVTNVGRKPTVGSEELLAETYIHDFDGDLYGRQILVEFLQFIRPEEKFPSLERLKEQIQQDSAMAAQIGISHL